MADANKSEPPADSNDTRDLISMLLEAQILFGAAIAGIEKLIDRGNLSPKTPELAALRRIAGQADEVISAVCSRLQAGPRPLLPTPAVKEPSISTAMAATLEVVAEALSFYAEETYYERPKTGRDRQSIIDKDGGDKALKALATLNDAQEAEADQ